MVQCLIGDNDCVDKCAGEYTQNFETCPCQEKCPAGCPCPEYQCQPWILVLYTDPDMEPLSAWLIIDGRGQSKGIGFSYGSGGTEVDRSCSIVWRGQMVVFGGYNYKRQISVVNNCQLTKKGELPFDMANGACAQRDNAEIFICFENWDDKSTWKNCHRSIGPLEAFSKLPSSTYEHRKIRIAVTSGKPCHGQFSLTTF